MTSQPDSRGRPRPDAATAHSVGRRAGELGTLALRHLDEHLEWYRELEAQEKSWVGLVAQAGIAEFVTWIQGGEEVPPSAITVFANAPSDLTRSVSLRDTLDLVRAVVDVVESQVTTLAAPGDEQVLRESVLRFSREIAFAAAEVYAGAAEVRGAWDARLESLVVDAVLRGQADESMQSRAAALGWGQTAHVTVVAGPAPSTRTEGPSPVDRLRRLVQRGGVDALATVQRNRLIAIIGGTTDPHAVLTAIEEDAFGPGVIVVGPTVPHLFAAGRSARAALSGLDAARGWSGAPRVTDSDQLLPERALAGELRARRALIARIHAPLAHPASDPLRATADAYLATGGSLEATARSLFVHTNTVRYRLGRIAERIGYDLADPRDRWTVQLALSLARITETAPVNLHALTPPTLEETSRQ